MLAAVSHRSETGAVVCDEGCLVMGVVATAVVSGFADVALNGPLLAAVPVALLAGLVSFASPCILPLVPGYLAYAAGLAGRISQRPTRTVVGATCLFVAGFTVVYVAAGLAIGAAGVALAEHGRVLTQIMGVVVAVMGLAMMGVLPSLPQVPVRWKPPAGLVGAPMLGAVLAVTWSPCLGPVLAAVLALGASTQSMVRSVVLLTVYCVGLGLPFVAMALGVGRSLGAWEVLRRFRGQIALVSGGLVVVLGVLLALDWWVPVIDAVRSVFPAKELMV